MPAELVPYRGPTGRVIPEVSFVGGSRGANSLFKNFTPSLGAFPETLLALSPNADTRNAGHGRVADYMSGLPSEFVEDAPLVAGSERSLKFVSSDSNYATLGSRLTTGSLTSLSACCWVKPTSDASSMAIMSEYSTAGNNRGWLLWKDEALVRLYISADGQNVYSRTWTGLEADAWTHIGVVFNDSDITIYVNGSAVSASASGDAVASLYDTASDFSLGSHSGSASPFDGLLRDARVYPATAITADEMLYIATGGDSGAAPTATPAGQWDMDGSDAGTSTVTDSSGNGNHLALTNFGTRIEDQTVDADEAAYVVDVPDVFKSSLQTYSLEFDGTDDYVEVPYSEALGFTGAYTISFWVKFNSVKSYSPIFMRGESNADDVEVYFSASDLFMFHNRGNGGTQTYIRYSHSMTADVWYHWAITYNGTDDWTIYLDGVPVASGPTSGVGTPPLDTNRLCRIGWAENSDFGPTTTSTVA